MKKTLRLSIVFALFSLGLAAQENTEFKPNGKPVLRIFSNYHATFTEGESAQAFELTRVYLGYEHNFSEKWSGAALLDVGDPNDGGDFQMTAYVKNAYLKYKSGDLTINFGLIATTQFKVQEGAWGYRYIAKSFQDQYKYNSSADLGISVSHKIGDIGSVDLIVANGEGYKKIEADSTFRTGLGLTLTPVDGLTLRGYYDRSAKDETQSSIAGFLGYETDMFSLGAEYNKMLNFKFADSEDLDGISFFGTFNMTDHIKLFGRYDNLSSNVPDGETDPWQLSKDGQFFIAGFEYSPVKGIKLAPNYQGWNPADDTQALVSTFILNCEVKF